MTRSEVVRENQMTASFYMGEMVIAEVRGCIIIVESHQGEEFAGTVLYKGEDETLKIGEYYARFIKEAFKKFEGKIVLTSV
jgi:hypothetical protein